MNIAEIAARRHSCKAFDPQRAIPDALLGQLLELLRLSPSSVNSQPWHFFIAGSQAGKQAIASATAGIYHYNTPKLLDCSHAVAICVRRDIDTAWQECLLAQEVADGRLPDEAAAAKQRETRAYYVGLHREEQQDLPAWLDRQAYLALGSLLLGAASLGIDACPIEGFDAAVLDDALGLGAQGLRGVVLVALGYRSAADFNAALPKSRLPASRVITRL